MAKPTKQDKTKPTKKEVNTSDSESDSEVSSKKEVTTSKKGGKSNKDTTTDLSVPNIETEKAHLHLNVNIIKKWLQSHYENEKPRERVKTKKEGKNDEPEEEPDENSDESGDDESKSKKKSSDSFMIRGCQYVLTATEETVCLKLVGDAYSSGRMNKNTAGMLMMTDKNLMDTIKMDKDLKYTYDRYLDSYSADDKYVNQLGIKRDDYVSFIENFGFGGGNKNVMLDSGGFNFLMYILLKTRIMMANTALLLAQYKYTKSIDSDAMLFSVMQNYIGEIVNSIKNKSNESLLAMKDYRIEKHEADEKRKSDPNYVPKTVGKKKTEKKSEKKTEKKPEKKTEKKPEKKVEKKYDKKTKLD